MYSGKRVFFYNVFTVLYQRAYTASVTSQLFRGLRMFDLTDISTRMYIRVHRYITSPLYGRVRQKNIRFDRSPKTMM